MLQTRFPELARFRPREVVRQFAATLRRELDLAFALCGCPNVASVTRELVEP